MRTANLKFGLLALLCLGSVVPIIGNVQKQAAIRPQPSVDRDAQRRSKHIYQRRALRQWLLEREHALSVAESPTSPRVFLVTLNPHLDGTQMLDQARIVRQTMTFYFWEGSHGAVTTVDLRSSRTEIVVKTGLHDAPTVNDCTWHLLEHDKVID